MKISIITVTYNSANTIEDTLKSVLNQDYEDFEHIVIDGGSTDDTIRILKRYEPLYQGRLKWLSEIDKGIYDGMNKGIDLASGDVIGILNGDDFYAAHDVLKRIAEGIKDVDAVVGDLVFVDPNNTSKIVRKWKGSQHYPGAFRKGWHPAHPTFYLRKSKYEEFGGYDISLNVSSDFELMLRMFEVGKITSRYLPFDFIKMRMGGESTGSIRKIIRGNINVMKAFRKNGLKISCLYPLRRLSPKVISLIQVKLHLKKYK